MLETAVGDGAKKFGLQQEVAETSGVDADVGTLLGVDSLAGGDSLSLLAVGGSGGLIVELVVGVVDEILFGRHVGGWCGGGDDEWWLIN